VGKWQVGRLSHLLKPAGEDAIGGREVPPPAPLYLIEPQEKERRPGDGTSQIVTGQ
jgi:hypothetical protein